MPTVTARSLPLYRYFRRTALAAALPLCALASGCAPRANPELNAGTAPRLAAAEAEVEAVYRAGIAAFNRHALGEFIQQFDDDIIMYTPTGWLRGRTAVQARFDSTFRQFPRVRMEIDSLAVRASSATTVLVAFRWRVFPMGAGPAFHGVGSGVYVRREGGWKEVLEHETVTRVDEALQPRQANER